MKEKLILTQMNWIKALDNKFSAQKAQKICYKALILIVFFSIICYGQEPGEVEIKGTIANNAAEAILIGENSLPLTKAGTFIYKAATGKPQFLAVKYQDKLFKIFMEPNEKMEISFDAKNMDNTIKFKGNSPATNLFLFKKSKIDDRLNSYFDQRKSTSVNLFRRDEGGFMQEMDSLKSLYLKPLADLSSKNNNINKRFLFEIKNSINFFLDTYILYYPQEHKRITQKQAVLGHKRRAYIDSINLDNPDLIGVDGYAEFGQDYLTCLLYENYLDEFKTKKELKRSDNQSLQSSLDLIENIYKKQAVKDFWRFKSIYKHIYDNGVKNIGKYVESFNQTCLSDEYKNAINSFYNKESKNREGHLIKTYKTIDGFELDAHIFVPGDLKKEEKRPALVKFHGGSWSSGTPEWDSGYSNLGFIKVCIEYRTFDRYRKLPFEQISDAKSAIRWVRENADKLHIDKNKIIAEGTSAGAHLALSTALLDILDEPNENRSVSSIPNALILNSTPFDLTEWIWFEEFVVDKERIKDISPNQNIKKGLPPMLLFHGTSDFVSAPYRHCETFVKKMKDAGNEIYFYPIEGQGHFMWWFNEYRQVSEKAKQEFFKKLGYL